MDRTKNINVANVITATTTATATAVINYAVIKILQVISFKLFHTCCNMLLFQNGANVRRSPDLERFSVRLDRE